MKNHKNFVLDKENSWRIHLRQLFSSYILINFELPRLRVNHKKENLVNLKFSWYEMLKV